jgi:hypothetical protein
MEKPFKIDYKNRSRFALEEMIRFGKEAAVELARRDDKAWEKYFEQSNCVVGISCQRVEDTPKLFCL